MSDLRLVAGPFDDWFVLHGGANWASIEGTAEEWREVADALEAGKGDVRHKRLAATLRNGEWGFYSPRNAAGERDHVRLAPKHGPALAAHIRTVLAAYAGQEQAT